MKPSNITYTLGLSLIILGLSLGLFPSKELPEAEIKPISSERSCMIEALYFEGRNTSLKERTAIFEVIANRVKSKNYPNTICGVINQPRQFSYKNNFQENSVINLKFNSMNSIDRQAYLEIEKIVDSKLVQGKIKPNKLLNNNVLHFHTKEVSPVWSSNKSKISLDNYFKHRYYSFVD